MPHSFKSSGVDPRLAGGRLTVDLAALAANYRSLHKLAAPATVAGVVKADAYGLGAEQVAPALWEAGCRRFFVAMPEEGRRLRAIVPEAEIFVLAGLFSEEAALLYTEARLIPVLNTQREVALWEAHCGTGGSRFPCAIHVDTGMNRLGLTVERALTLARENALTGAIRPVLLMSHLACADAPAHPLNRRQIESFQAVSGAFEGVESSLANSAGIFLGQAAHFDLVRPGIALYGGSPVSGGANPMQPVATAEARITQVRRARAGETVSYGGTRTLSRDSLLAVVTAGYADGYHRASSGAGVPLRAAVPEGGHGFVAGRRVPVAGRVTMDLTIFDVTDCGPDAVQPGDYIELFGPNIPVDEAAAAAGTISYELLTSLGKRYARRYVSAGTGDAAADG